MVGPQIQPGQSTRPAGMPTGIPWPGAVDHKLPVAFDHAWREFLLVPARPGGMRIGSHSGDSATANSARPVDYLVKAFHMRSSGSRRPDLSSVPKSIMHRFRSRAVSRKGAGDSPAPETGVSVRATPFTSKPTLGQRRDPRSLVVVGILPESDDCRAVGRNRQHIRQG